VCPKNCNKSADAIVAYGCRVSSDDQVTGWCTSIRMMYLNSQRVWWPAILLSLMSNKVLLFKKKRKKGNHGTMFFSHQINEQYFSAWLFSEANRTSRLM
jgi:hypothetical protein